MNLKEIFDRCTRGHTQEPLDGDTHMRSRSTSARLDYGTITHIVSSRKESLWANHGSESHISISADGIAHIQVRADVLNAYVERWRRAKEWGGAQRAYELFRAGGEGIIPHVIPVSDDEAFHILRAAYCYPTPGDYQIPSSSSSARNPGPSPGRSSA